MSGWRDRAACRDLGCNADVFFPVLARDPAWDAKQFCHACPVRLDCLRHALKHDIRDGVWGGFTAEERANLRGAA